MNIGAYASAKEIAVNDIAEKLGVNLSTSALPKAPNPQILELFRLQKIAQSIDGESSGELVDLEEVLETIKGIKGVGVALYFRIEQTLRE